MIIITGASRGIGKAIATQLAKEGKNLWLVNRNQKTQAEIVQTLKAINSEITIRTSLIDLANKTELMQFIDEIKSANTPIEALINNAGFALDLSPFPETIDDDIEDMINVNIRALFLLTKHVSAIMQQQNSGHIINIGSTAAITAYTNAAVYCATKAAVKTFTDGLRLDLMASNIKVTLIQPGIVETDFSLIRFKGDKSRAEAVYTGIEALSADDIANSVSYVLNTPQHVQIAELTIMATHQGNGFTLHRQ